MFDIKSIEVVEELGHPLVHNLMIGPSELEFVEEDGSTLRCLGAEGGEDSVGQIVFNRFTMSLVEFS